MQNRRKFLVQGSLAVGAAALLKPFQGFSTMLSHAGINGNDTLTILHTSDLHLADFSTNNAVEKNLYVIKEAINAIRKNSPNTILLHNGNIFEASSNNTAKNKETFNKFTSIGYDAVAFGTNDLHHNTELFNNNSISFINSINENSVTNLNILPYKIVKRGSLKVGIIANPANTSFFKKSVESTAEILSNTAENLKTNKGCNIVICLSTGNLTNNETAIKFDKNLAMLTTNVDVIISGNNEIERPINLVCKNAKKEEVLIHSSSFKGSSVGRIDINFCTDMQKRDIKVYYKNSWI